MSVQSFDNNRYWTALKYTKPQQFKTTPALKNSLGNIAISMKHKEAIIQKSTFLPPPKSTLKEPKIPVSTTYSTITKEQVYNPLIAQSTQKGPSQDKINFGILLLIWNEEAKQMTQIV